MTDINDHPRFKHFRQALQAAGITLQPWQFITPDIHGFTIVGAHPDAPKRAIAVVRGDGFDWFPESTSLRFADDIRQLTGYKPFVEIDGPKSETET